MAITPQDLERLAYSIENAVSQSIKAGADAVIVPERQKFVQEIKKDLESGQIDRVEGVIDRLSNTIDDLGEDLENYGDVLQSDVVNNLKELVKQKQQSELEVKNLRQQGIIAEVKSTEKNNELSYKATLLTNKQIKDRQLEVLREEKEIIKREKELQKDIIKYQKGPEDEEKAQELLERKEEIATDKERILADKESLGDKKELSFLDELKENIPDTFKDMFDSFKDTLMAPVEAIKNLGQTFKNLGTGILKTVKLFGTLAKGLGKLLISVMAAVGSFLLAALPFIAIGGAIIALGYGLYKLGQRLGIFDKEPEFRNESQKQQYNQIKTKIDNDEALTPEDEMFLKANPQLAKAGGEEMEAVAFKETQQYENIQNRGTAGDLAGEASMFISPEDQNEFLQSDQQQKNRIEKFKEGQKILFDKGLKKGGLINVGGVETDLAGFKNLIMEDALTMDQVKGATIVNVDNSKTDNSNKSGTNISTSGLVTDPGFVVQN